MNNEFMRTDVGSSLWFQLPLTKRVMVQLSCDGTFVVPRNGPGVDKYPSVVLLVSFMGPFSCSTHHTVIPSSLTKPALSSVPSRVLILSEEWTTCA
jgi:hypothetical protein